MNDTKLTDTPRKQNRSVIYKAAFYGITLSILFAIAAVYFGGLSGLQLIGLVMYYLCEPFGYDPLAYHNSNIAQDVNYIILPVLTNALILFLFELLAWFLFSRLKKDKFFNQ